MRKLPILALVVLLVLAGCSALSSGADFETAVEAEHTATVGSDYPVEVTVENVGSDAGEYTAELAVDGEIVAEESANVSPDGTVRLRLVHVFNESGSYTVTIADKEYMVEVVDPQETLANHNTAGSYSVDETVTHDYVYRFDDGNTTEGSSNMRYVVKYGFDDQRMHAEFYDDALYGTTTAEYAEQWYVDGVYYEKTGRDAPEYYAYGGNWSNREVTLDPDNYLAAMANASVEYGGGATVYSADESDTETIEAVSETLDKSAAVPPGGLADGDQEITEFESKVIVEDGYVTLIELRITTNNTITREGMSDYEFEQTIDITAEYDGYNEEFNITVPEDVRDNVDTPSK